MSISSMVDTKLARENPASKDDHPQPVGVDTGIVNQLTRWIPSESILLYVALLAAFGSLKPAQGKEIDQLDYTSRWFALLGFAGITVVLVILLTVGKARANGKDFKFPIFEVCAATVGFMGWAVALPDTPLLDFKGYNIAIGGFILLATTVAIAVLAFAFGRSPTIEKVVSKE